MTDIELEFRDLKAKFENAQEIVFNDEETLTNKEFSNFAEELLELIFRMLQLMRTYQFRIETLEKAARFGDLTKLVEEEKKYPVAGEQDPDGSFYL